MKKIEQIEIDLYQAVLWVYVGSAEDCAKELSKTQLSERSVKDWKEAADKLTDTNGMYTHIEDENISILWLARTPKNILEYAHLVHETEHYVFYLFDRIGLEHTTASDESYAYTMAYVFKKIAEIIERSKRKA